MKPVRARLGGFTLVELLVVIGIIAVLLAILLPVLSSVRRSAQNAECLSNLRQIHQSLVVYAQENRDLVPVGYRAGQKQFNSMVYSATANRFVLFGLLYQRGLMKSPRIYFCAAEQDETRAFNTPRNPWPPGPDGDPSINVFAGYALRPDVEIPDDWSLLGTGNFRVKRLSDFGSKAILADTMATPERLNTRHRSGLNVLFAHGGAAWVDRGQFDAPLKECTAVNAAFNPQQDQIWRIFDRN